MYANHRNPRFERSSRSYNPIFRYDFRYMSPAEQILRSAGRITVERLENMGVLPMYTSRNRSHWYNRRLNNDHDYNRSHWYNRRLNNDHDYNRRNAGLDASNVGQNQNFGLRNKDIPPEFGPTQNLGAQREDFGLGLNDLGNSEGAVANAEEKDDVESLESREVREGDHEEVEKVDMENEFDFVRLRGLVRAVRRPRSRMYNRRGVVRRVRVGNAVDLNEEAKSESEEKSLGEDVEKEACSFENVPTKQRVPQRRSRFEARNVIVEGEVDMDVETHVTEADANVQETETVQNLMNLPEPEPEVVEVVRRKAYKVCDLNLAPPEIIEIEDDDQMEFTIYESNRKKLITVTDLVEDNDSLPGSNSYCSSGLMIDTMCSSSNLTGNGDSCVTFLEFGNLCGLG